MRSDPLLRMVPGSAAARLAGRPVRLLSLRDVLRGLEGSGAVLLSVQCELDAAVAPVLRAARDRDAVVGLGPAALSDTPRAPHAFFEALADTAEAIGHSRAVVLAAPPVRVGPDGAEAAEARVYDWVDAGYTHVPIDISGLEPEEAAPAVARAASALVERELGLEVLLEPGQEDAAGELAAGLKLLGCPPDLVGVRGGEGVGLAVVTSEIEPLGASWREGEADEDLRSGLRNALGAGVRLVSLRSPITRAVAAGLPAALPEELLASAAERGGLEAGAEALARRLAGLEGDALDRVEARVHGELIDLCGVLGLGGSHRRLEAALAGG